MRLLRFMGYPINNFSSLELSMARQVLALRMAGSQGAVVFDGVMRQSAAAGFAAVAGPEAIITTLPVPTAGVPGLMRYFWSADRLIRSWRPDVVHAYFAPSSHILNMLALLHPSVRFVRTVGSTPIPSARGARFPTLRQYKWRATLRNLTAVVCVAPHIRNMLARMGVPAARLHVIPNPTDVGAFQPRLLWPDDEPIELAFIGRLVPIKNLKNLIRGVAMACTGAHAVPLRLTIWGYGPQADELAALIAELKVADRVRLGGRAETVVGALASAHVYVQASHHEGCPAAVGEAMAAGLPVVLSDIPGHRQMMDEGVEGNYFDAAQPEALARVLVQLWHERARIPAMGAAARARACAQFSIEQWIASESVLYDALLGHRP